jgi:hypothetical protein
MNGWMDDWMDDWMDGGWVVVVMVMMTMDGWIDE